MTSYKYCWYKHCCHKKSWLIVLVISLLFGILSSNAFAAPAKFTTKYTQAEIDWLKLNSNIKVAVSSDYAPISFMQGGGQYAGISADYLAQIEQHLKAINPTFKFKLVLPSKDERAANDPLTKHVNMVVDFVETPDRLKYWQFTKHYMTMPLHLIVRQDSRMTSNLSHIGNVKIVVVDYCAARELFASDHPNLELILVNTTQEGLKKVTFGEVQGFVSDLPVASY